MSEANVLVLDYVDAGRARQARRRRLLHRAGLLVALAVAATFFVRRGAGMWIQTRAWYDEHRCAVYTAPPNLVVYEENPVEVAKLRSNPNYSFERREVDPPSALFHAGVLDGLNRWTPNGTFTWAQMPCATVFLHKLKVPWGPQRLVKIEYVHQLAHSVGHDGFYLDAETMDTSLTGGTPTWVRSDPIEMDNEWHNLFDEKEWRRPGYLTMYAGQLDDADPSRFSIRVRRNSLEGFIDGWLADDASGPVVHMRVRSALTMTRQMSLQYSQQLEQYAAPPDQLVFDDDPSRAAALRATGEYQIPEWFDRRDSYAGHEVPSVWHDHYIAYPGTSNPLWGGQDRWLHGPVLFLGSRSSGGVTRIIRIDLNLNRSYQTKVILQGGLEVAIFRPATETQPISLIGERDRGVSFDPPEKPIRFFAGQRDAQDPSHFTIRYEYGDQYGAIDGWLLSEAQSIRFKAPPSLPLSRAGSANEIVCCPISHS